MGEAGNALNCATHPQVETSLRCSRCERPICPACMVSTPVGYRCRECAGVRVLPQLNLRPMMLGRAVTAGAGLMLAGGLAWALVSRTGFLMLLIVAGIGVGYGVAEGVSRAAGRRSSPALPVIAGVSAGLSVLAGNVMLYWFFTDLGFAFALRQALHMGIWTMLAGLLAVLVAVGRLRS